jgi:hypothetical protein
MHILLPSSKTLTQHSNYYPSPSPLKCWNHHIKEGKMPPFYLIMYEFFMFRKIREQYTHDSAPPLNLISL